MHVAFLRIYISKTKTAQCKVIPIQNDCFAIFITWKYIREAENYILEI